MIDETSVIQDYTDGASLRKVAALHGIDHHRVKRILVKNGVEIRQPKRCVGLRKYENAFISKYANMANHLRFDVSLSWLLQFQDYEKLKFLNKQIINRDRRFNESTEWYVQYIEHFYCDETFNRLYKRYLDSGKQKYFKPSLDHITPRSLGGTNDLDNLQYVTLLENMCKRNIPNDDWIKIRANISDYFM